MKVFYLDSFLLLNLTLDYLLLLLTAKLTGVFVKRRWLFLSAVTGAIFSVGIFFLPFGKVPIFLFSAAAAWIMVSIGFYAVPAGKRVRLLGIFLLQALGFSGLMELLKNIGVGSIQVQNGVAYIQIEFWQIVFSGVGACLIVQLCFRDHSFKLEKQRVVLRTGLAEKRLETLLLVDTGNLLREPLSGKPVILLAPNEVGKLLPDCAAACLRSADWDASVLMAMLVEQGVVTRLIPLKTAAGDCDLTLAVKPDNITLEKEGKMKKTDEYWIGIARKDIDVCGGCRGVIGV